MDGLAQGRARRAVQSSGPPPHPTAQRPAPPSQGDLNGKGCPKPPQSLRRPAEGPGLGKLSLVHVPSKGDSDQNAFP